ncbi:MAG: CHAD domain-containing protein [Halomonas sp.]
MRQLFLLRHAKARQASGDMSDHQRPLRRRGQRQAAAMAAPLKRWGALAGEIHVSSARRTRETLAAIDAALPGLGLRGQAHYHDALYTFAAPALLDWLRSLPDEVNRVLVIGHNPALLELAHWLCREVPDSLPTGGLLHLTVPAAPWPALERHGARLAASLVPETASHALFQRRAPASPRLHKAELAERLRGQLGHLYRRIRALEPGVIAGVDPEFLHQYRVNLRRSRAIGEAVLATTRQAGRRKIPGLKKRLKRLKRRAQATSELRDLNVFLESLVTAPPPLGEETRSALHDWLSVEASKRHERLCRQLRQSDYADDMQVWLEFLDSAGFKEALARLSATQIEAVLAERLTGHDRDLAELMADSPDEAFHDLRKAVKRIRYLAELEPKRQRAFLKGLKQRQTLLGDFQDLCTRLAWLAAFAADADAAGREACDAWRRELEEQKRRLREQIMALPPLSP